MSSGRVQKRPKNHAALQGEGHVRNFYDYVREKEKIKNEEEERQKAERILAAEEIRNSAPQYEAEQKAEQIRREALSPAERLREDGEKLQQKIETDDEMHVILETSIINRAKCRAAEDCLEQLTSPYNQIGISYQYRICVQGVENQEWFGRRKDCYHVRCFSHMVDLYALMPSKFTLHGATVRWPLMVQKWYQHKGHIDLDKIAAHISDQQAYLEVIYERSDNQSDWDHNHLLHCLEEPEKECKCPEMPPRPPKPTLESGAAEGKDRYSLVDVLEHPGCRVGIPYHLDRVL